LGSSSSFALLDDPIRVPL